MRGGLDIGSRVEEDGIFHLQPVPTEIDEADQSRTLCHSSPKPLVKNKSDVTSQKESLNDVAAFSTYTPKVKLSSEVRTPSRDGPLGIIQESEAEGGSPKYNLEQLLQESDAVRPFEFSFK